MKNTKITTSNYTKFLVEIRRQVDETKNEIIESITRHKVVMAWQIGKLIDEHLRQNSESDYGKRFFKKLESDIGIAEKVLYKMRSFYKSYPKIPKADSKLNWSHYRVLSKIKKTDERKYFEDLTQQNNWDAAKLQMEVVKLKNSLNKNAQIRNKMVLEPSVRSTKKLYPVRGKLFSYSLIQLGIDKKIYIDCGFKVFRELEESLSKAVREQLSSGSNIIDVRKKDKNYSVKKSQLHPRKLNVYKAYVSRVVDGDTIHVILDLGFKIMHEEILRLKGINTSELNTNAGKSSSRRLSRILKNAPFLIVKSFATDIYGRRVADVFLAKKGEENSDPQKVADEGDYLNQMLLDLGVASRF